MPNIPQSNRKRLRVIPFLIKNPKQGKNLEWVEYLVDKSAHPFTTITFVHVVELLAGIPWTTNRARQHVVNEVSQCEPKVVPTFVVNL